METLSNVAVSAVTPCIFMQKNFFFVVVLCHWKFVVYIRIVILYQLPFHVSL